MSAFWSLFWLSILLIGLTSIGCGVGYGLAKPGKPDATAHPSKIDIHMLSSTNNGSMVYSNVQVNLTSVFKHGIWLEYGVLDAYLEWGTCRVTKTISLPPPPTERLHARQQSWMIKFDGASAAVGPDEVRLPTDTPMVRLVVKSSVRWKLRKIFIKKGRSAVTFRCPLQQTEAACEVNYH